MSAFEAFQTYAEVTVTFSGLIAVVVVLRGRADRAWTNEELFGALHVLVPGLIAMISSLIPLALFASYGESTVTWRIAHGLFALCHLIGPLTYYAQPQEVRTAFSGLISNLFGLGSAFIILSCLLIAGGVVTNFVSLVYFIGLTWLIFVNIYTFASMLINSGRDV